MSVLVKTVANSLIINGLTVTMDQVARFAPLVTLHVAEPYLPCSIDELLATATLVDNSGAVAPIQNPTQAELAEHHGENFRVDISPLFFGGRPLAADGTVTAPMYVAVQVPQDRSYVDLNFIWLFAYNGPQTVRVKVPYNDYNAILPQFAEHQGDIEGCTVRVTPDFSSIIFVRCESHGDSSYYPPRLLDYSGTHPIIRSSLNAHGSFNGKGKNPNDWIVKESYEKLGTGGLFIDIITSTGPAWCPFDNGQLVFVGLDEQGRPINGQLWAAFQGRIGGVRDNSYQGAVGVGGSQASRTDALSWAQRNWANLLVDAVSSLIPNEDKSGTGPVGLGDRKYIRMCSPTWGLPKKDCVVQSRVHRSVTGEYDLVLSIDPANPSGALILATFDPSNDGQKWTKMEFTDGFSLVNKRTMLAAFVPNGNGNRVTQVPVTQVDEYSLWTLGGDEGADFHAVRPLHDSGQNLNVFGNNDVNSAGAAVGTWGWGGGNNNETWRFVSAS